MTAYTPRPASCWSQEAGRAPRNLPILERIVNHPDPTPQFTVWSVLGPDGVTHGFYATLDDQGDQPGARTGSIGCWEKNEPVAPEYSWQPVDGGWELTAGGYWTGVYLMEHDVHGRVEQAAPPDQAALCDRIAEALATTDGWKWAPGFKEHSPTWRDYQRRADAVLAVLRGLTLRELEQLHRPNTPPSRSEPKTPPTDRAAVLREAADVVHQTIAPADWTADSIACWNTALNIAENRLRRLAAETQQAKTETRAALMRAHAALATQAGRDQAALTRVREWVTSDVVTARSGFGDGYREAQRDIRDLLPAAPAMPVEAAADDEETTS